MRIVTLATLAFASAAGAQTSELFINEFLGNNMVVVQGGSVIRSWQTISGAENALAVANGEIRTGGSGIYGWTGHQYDTSGNFLGGTYNTSPGQGNYYDGTTDGVNYNYAIQHNGAYQVFRFDRNWSNGTPLFSVDFPDSGIAYDTTDGSFWLSHAFSPAVHHYDANGNLLGTFGIQGNYAYGLALDPADGTLWAGQYGSNVITQYKKDGTYLGAVTVPGISHAFGMEFDVGRVPAPGAAALLGLGALATGRRRR